MKRIPFDLVLALNGYKVVTRDNEEVDNLVHIERLNQIVYTVVGYNGIYKCNINGLQFDDRVLGFDLFILAKTKKLWIAINPNERDGGIHNCSHCYPSIDLLKQYKQSEYTKMIEIEVE